MDRKPIVVVVDNNPEIREVLSGVLEALSFDTRRADGVGEAIRLIEELDVSAVVTDVEMYPRTGFDLPQHCRDSQRGIPVVMVSSYSNPKMRKRALAEGAVEFLAKPFTMEDLNDALERGICQTAV